MLLQIFLLLLGLVVLYFGAEAMVKGASQMALDLGISPMIVGLTVVAFGTSAPELLVSFIAAWNGASGISVGNIVGSNICNVALILGTAAVLAPLAISVGALRREYPIMLGACLAFYAVSFDGHIAPWEGWLLFAGITAFVIYNLRAVSKHRKGAEAEIAMEEVESDPDSSQVRNLLYLIFGLLGLAGGAHLMVESSTTIARAFGISDFVIGITIIAFGTSLPELATSVVAAFRGEADISVGNVFGSNIFNSLFVMGLIPGIFGMDVEPRAVQVDFPAMVAITLLAFPLMRTRYKLSRIEGAILLVLYGAYIASLFLFPQGLPSS